MPISTAECDEGPIIQFTLGDCRVRYDGEDQSGTIWTEVRFHAALAMRFTPDSFVKEEMIAAYSRVCVLEPSPWVDELQGRQQQERLRPSIRHFVLYFDHVGAVEVLAESAELVRTAGGGEVGAGRGERGADRPGVLRGGKGPEEG